VWRGSNGLADRGSGARARLGQLRADRRVRAAGEQPFARGAALRVSNSARHRWPRGLVMSYQLRLGGAPAPRSAACLVLEVSVSWRFGGGRPCRPLAAVQSFAHHSEFGFGHRAQGGGEFGSDAGAGCWVGSEDGGVSAVVDRFGVGDVKAVCVLSLGFRCFGCHTTTALRSRAASRKISTCTRCLASESRAKLFVSLRPQARAALFLRRLESA
jgi:hypothetical protein